MLESDASAWFSLSDLAEERAADWLAAAVNIATAVLGGGLDCLKRLLHASGSSAAVVGAAIESATRPQNALLITNVIPWLITLPEDVPFRLPDGRADHRAGGVSNVWLGLTNAAKYLLVRLLVFD